MISRSRYLPYNPVLKRNAFSLLKNLITLTPNRIKDTVFHFERMARNRGNRVISRHLYGKRQTWIFTTWPSFLLTCALLFISSFYPKISSLTLVLDCFYHLIFYLQKFSTWIWCLPFAVNITLNLSYVVEVSFKRLHHRILSKDNSKSLDKILWCNSSCSSLKTAALLF